MVRLILLYSAVVAGLAFLLEWVEFQYQVRVFSTEIYVVVVAVVFTGLGAYAGYQLTPALRRAAFEPNQAALDSLGISKREYDVLELLAQGHSNREIARSLYVSPNTVKTHLGNLYGKLEVSRRTQAVQKARSLRMIP